MDGMELMDWMDPSHASIKLYVVCVQSISSIPPLGYIPKNHRDMA